MWTMKKTKTSIELDFNEELAFQQYFSDFGEKCEEAGERNINWLIIKTYYSADLQYKSYQRGLHILFTYFTY